MAASDIGPYRILRLLKRGGAGAVYVAWDRRLKRKVALKLLPVPPERGARERVIAEARLLAACEHRCLVQIYDVVEARSHLVLVLEYVAGIDLEELMALTRIELPAALQIATDICSGLAAVHHEGIVHRDLKPANVLVDGNGRTRLTDFGIAARLRNTRRDGSTVDGVAGGSYLAMSPEHAGGRPLDARSDLFSLGLILYRLLAGTHPFAGSGSELGALQSIIHDAHPPLQETGRDIPEALCTLVDQLLAKNPGERPSSALAVKQELLSITRSLPLSRGNVLAALASGKIRPDDAGGSPPALPEEFSSDVHSHLLNPGEWSRWILPPPRRQFSAVWMTLALLVFVSLCYTLLQWWQGRPLAVTIDTVHVVGTGANPGAAELTLLLQEEALAQSAFRPVADRKAAPLRMQVQCDAYLCGAHFSLQMDGVKTTDYRTVQTGAPVAVWQSVVRQGVASIAAQR
jgi:serine/threonine protein kinase